MATTPEALVRQYFTFLAEGKGREAFALLSPDATYRVMGTTALSVRATGVREILDTIIKPLIARLEGGTIELIPDEFLPSGSTVVVLAHSRATGATGLPYNNEYVLVFRTDGEHITAVDEYLDTVLVETAIFGRRLAEAE